MAATFRFQGRRVHLTYKSHIDKEAFKTFATESWGCSDIHMAHESGDENHPYPHTHVIAEWPKTFQTRDARKFDIRANGEPIHPNIKPITTREHLENSYRYLAKEDPECAYLLELQTTAFCKSVWSCKSLAEAMRKNVETPSQALGVIATYKAKPTEEPPAHLIIEMREWQQCFMNEISDEPDDRHIIWIYDPIGGAGKSRLAAHIEDSHIGIVLSGTLAMRDVAFIIKTEIEAKGPLGVIIVDLTRSFQERDIYNVLEALKNGRMISPKYESCRLRWKPGHVAVFANFLPEPGRVSQDRWIIHQISGPERNSLIDFV